MKTIFRKLSVAALTILTVSFNLFAQEEGQVRDLGKVVVTGNKFETPIEKSGKVIYKITADEISNSPGRTVADLLNQLPGINVDGAFGTLGTNLDYNIRGGRNAQTLILIDGLPINDPSSIANDYDLRLLNAQAVEYIEVLKGAASTLYGTGAAAGVINIKMKAPSTEVPKVTLSQSIGSFSTSNTNADVQGKTGKFSYLVAGAFAISEGISAAQDNDPATDFGNDGFHRYSGRTKFGYDFSEAFNLGANFSYEKLRSDYDNGAFADADNEFTLKQTAFGLNPKLKYNKGNLQLRFNYNQIERDFISAYPSKSEGENTQADLTNEYIFSSRLKTIVGVQYQGYKFVAGDDEPNATNIDPYLNLAADLTDALTLNAGARLNINSEYGSNFVYSVNPSYLFDLGNESKLKAFGSYSTAFISPSLYQLFAPLYGNTELEPQETKSAEFGLSLYLGNNFTVNAEYFKREEENAIDFVSRFDQSGNYVGGGYANVTGVREIEGYEIDFQWQIIEPLSFSGHLASYQFGNPAQFYRIPDLKLGFNTRYAITSNTSVGVNYTRFGEREAAIFSDPYLVKLEAYNMVDLSISHKLFDGTLTLSGTVNNLLDEDFVGVYGFTTRPANFTIGITGSL
ncbi:TonB-dependent receptor plug domain-containing protein [uncultured Roseivirga sp.]|uniref:TonB-dependent receptor plug domain-containing protein n=1 Tax=uncultured Roseivirga sp. TaxID=543088 RepID=UPI0030DA52AA|tara:strand:- start:205174 stop:207054 length:1881 start_codon:yes stop_codon:yes gene_type:complete